MVLASNDHTSHCNSRHRQATGSVSYRKGAKSEAERYQGEGKVDIFHRLTLGYVAPGFIPAILWDGRFWDFSKAGGRNAYNPGPASIAPTPENW